MELLKYERGMLQRQLEQNRDSILRKWFEYTINTYKPEMIRFLKRDKNPFSNPVRHTIVTGLERIFDGIVSEINIETCYQGLDEIIKLRAVQSFSPSRALAFIFDLKEIVRNVLQSDPSALSMDKDLQVFEENLDRLIRLAFDIYSNCREKIHEIRMAETLAKSQLAFEMLGRRKNDL
jgi:hypothetical protein